MWIMAKGGCRKWINISLIMTLSKISLILRALTTGLTTDNATQIASHQVMFHTKHFNRITAKNVILKSASQMSCVPMVV